jgi:hypothetical protein
MQYAKAENLKEILVQVDVLLSQVEVKGESVTSLYRARAILKDFYGLIKEEKEEIKEVKEE